MANLGALAKLAGLTGAVGSAVYSSDAEASKFTDAMKLIDKFTAAHGTPHVFPPAPNKPLGEFKWDKIGTGEGAQAFTKGHYLAGDPLISRVHYRDRLTDDINRRIEANARNTSYDAQLAKLHANAIKQNLVPDKQALRSQFGVYPSTLDTIAKKLSVGKADPLAELAKLLDQKEHDKWWKKLKNTRGYSSLYAESPFFAEVDGLAKLPPEQLFSADMFGKLKAYVDRSKPVTDARYGEVFEQYLKSKGLNATHSASVDIAKVWSQFAKEHGLDQSINPRDSFAAEDLLNKAKKIATRRAIAPKQGALQQLRDSLDTSKIKPQAAAPEYAQGALYTVEVGASPSKLLQLDMSLKELAQDLPDVYKAFMDTYAEMPNQRVFLDEYNTPYNIWASLPKDAEVQNQFSKSMDARGVPGAMFLSKGRRKLNTDYDFDPSEFNYVLYNDDTPQIVGRELSKPYVPKE